MSLHKNHSNDRCLDLWWKTTFHCEITKRGIKSKERRIASMVKALAYNNVVCSVQTPPLTHSPVTSSLRSPGMLDALLAVDHFGKYHNTLCLSPQTLHKHCFCFPKIDWNQCLSKIWGDEQRVLWYFPKWPIIF